MKKVHLGCWHRDFEGFINVDICDMPHIHYKSEINNLSFLTVTLLIIYTAVMP